MPCDSSYMNASQIEIELSRVYQLLDELDGKPIDPCAWRGYDNRAYNTRHTREQADALVSRLCERLKSSDVKQYSLEMQVWYRDHQRADAERERREAQLAEAESRRIAAISKLNDADRSALGITSEPPAATAPADPK